ncbi:MAG: hypothetical protein RSE41_08580, partial [Clostridia bacterium]
EGYQILVDGVHEKKVVIQRHSNPINQGLEDKQLTIIKEDSNEIKWGSIFEGYENSKYIVVGEPFSTDGVITKCKVRKLENKMRFKVNNSICEYDCISTKYLMYDDKTYVTDTKVFEDDDRLALVVKRDEHTSAIQVIDDVEVDGIGYRAIKEEVLVDENMNGIVQIVLLRTTFGELESNGNKLKGIIRFARMKDKLLNSKSRELITHHNMVKTGDYVTHTYKRDDKGSIENRVYMVQSLMDMKLDYDVTYLINCDISFNIQKENGEVITIPAYVENNRTKLQAKENNQVKFDDSQFQVNIQYNKDTCLIGTKINRIYVKMNNYDSDVYSVTGIDKLSLEGVMYVGLKLDKVDKNRDNEELCVADYKTIDNVIDPLKINGNNTMYIGSEEEYTLSTIQPASWNLSSNDYAEIISSDFNKVKVRAKKDNKNVGKTIELVAKVGELVNKKTIKLITW